MRDLADANFPKAARIRVVLDSLPPAKQAIAVAAPPATTS
jgi:hypothetical protein